MAEAFRQVPFPLTASHLTPVSSHRILTTQPCRYEQALQSASTLEQAAKDAAGKLRAQQNDFASHKKSIKDSVEKLRQSQFRATAWRYALKLVMLVPPRCLMLILSLTMPFIAGTSTRV